ncbi:MAG TPA: ImcF-related family protein [Bryobacteraceae bacterium]|nr:ImcF-related family protein [Bryobacteraceae bacterium]
MTPLYIVLGVAVVALVVLLVFYLRSRKKEKQKAAAGMPAGDAPGGDDIAVIVHEAEAKLAAAKLGKGARVANLPVYLLIGDPGATKTSVMLHCGLEPELVAGQVYVGGNVAPTRTANFWFSRRSLFVEAGGQMLADAGKWRSLVKKLQPRSAVVAKGGQAPRAAVVCFDCESFTRPGSTDLVANAARILRARLGEISQAMGINLPVYALFTKVDRLPYFTEYVRNLNNEEATQVLGVTLPMISKRSEGVFAEEETTRLTGQFERLFRALADARPEFLSRETDASKLPSAYEFPREFRKIRPAVVQFLVDLCRPSQLTVGPFLRGFYFTGVRPVVINEAAPVAAAAQQQQQGFAAPSGATGVFRARPDAQPQAQAPARPVISTRKVPQWLFLSHLFNDILLADRAAMGASGSSTRTSTARRVLFIAAAALCFLASVFFTISFFNNRGIETRVWNAARGIPPGEFPGPEFAPLESLQKLDVLRDSLETLMKYHRDGAPFFYKWGLYAGDDVYRAARPVYCSRFRQLLLKVTQANMVAYLRGLPGSNQEYRPAYEALRSYLITTTHPEKSDGQLPPVLMRFWQNGRAPDADRQALARRQFDFYQQDLLIENPCTSSPEAVTVAGAQQYLKRLGGAQRVYQAMLAEANKQFPPVNFNRKFPGSDKTVVDPYDVLGAFTKDGWKFMNDAIAHPDRYVKGEAWVLGDEGASNVDLARLALDIKPLYVNDFIKEWRAYVRSGRVQKYADFQDASDKLAVLSGNQSTLLEMISLASQNTAVDDPTVMRVFQPVQSVVPPGSTDRVIAPSNQGYMGALGQLQISIQAVAGQTPPNEAAAAATQGQAGQARGAWRTLAQGFTIDQEGHVDQQVQALLEEPITYAEALLRSAGPAELNGKGKALCAQISPVLAKYPFSPNATAPATLPEVDSVFKPKDGALWQFVDGELKKVVTHQGSQVTANPGGGVPLNPAFLAWLNRAAAFTEVAFKDGSADPHFGYNVKPVLSADIESITLTIDGQAAEFSAAAASPKPFVWPGSAHSVRLNVKFKGGKDYDYPNFDGLWAVFEWVAQADRRSGSVIDLILGAGQPKRPVTNPVTNQPVIVQFDISAEPRIFDKDYFRMPCVPTVAK